MPAFFAAKPPGVQWGVLSGDFATYPLADLLQWLDLSRRAGVLEIEGGGATFWIEVRERTIVAAARPPLPGGLQGLSGWLPLEDPETLWPEACYDRLVDLFVLPANGRFSFATDGAGFDDGVALQRGVNEVLIEGLRRLDEWPRLDRSYPDDAAALTLTGKGNALTPGLSAVMEAARKGLSLAQARLGLGLSRPAMLRRVEALREVGLVGVDGAKVAPDPVSALIGKAQVLVRERQFDEAALVFRSLIAADPGDRRVRHLLREAERDQVAALYEELKPFAVPTLRGGEAALKGRRLDVTDREVMGRINGRWDVASIALASPLREVETLKSLRKLFRLGLLDLAVRSPRP
jgi:hypothetical protein